MPHGTILKNRGWGYGGGQPGWKLKGGGGVVSIGNDPRQSRVLASISNSASKTSEDLLVCFMLSTKQKRPVRVVLIDGLAEAVSYYHESDKYRKTKII